MCLILFSWKTHAKFPLVLAANRDEFYDRPTAVAGFWEENPEVLAGRDLQAGGTWLGVTRSGRFAAITNYRDPQNIDAKAHSRGELTSNFLLSNEAPEAYLHKIKNSNIHYNGFNLLVGDSSCLFYFNNVNHQILELTPGTYGLSNGFLQDNWPKVKKGREQLKNLINQDDLVASRYIDILTDDQQAADALLPSTGVSMEWERALSPLFIDSNSYGTRCSTVLFREENGHGTFVEKTYAIGGTQEEGLVEYNF